MILVDTSGLLAALFPDQRTHSACARALREAQAPFVLSPFVLAEMDYLLWKLAGVDIELEFLAEVARGAYELAAFDSFDVEEAKTVIETFSDLGIGLADASLVVLARRLEVREVLTLDQRHFRSLTGFRGQPFRLLPADS